VPHVLIADDDRSVREALIACIKALGFEPEGVASGDAAVPLLDACDLLISDVRMPGMDGMALLGEARRRRPDLPVIMLTGHATVDLAVQAMRAGAANFIEKPFEIDDLEQAVRSALNAPAPAVAAPAPKPAKAGAPPMRASDIFIGESVAAQALRSFARRVAASEATVLVTGESGSGKEVVARTIHAQSRRARMPFVAVNCGAIPETLFGSAVSGPMTGVAVGATQTRIGRFGAAEGGTLLLDEIGELPLHLQVKLLRVLQERGYTPVGSSETRSADVRVIAATNRDLESMVAGGSFREDLFYRLNVLSVHVPPLRERGDDAFQLARTFLWRAAEAEGKGTLSFDEDVVVCLKRYGWPGNVRELEHAVTRATVLAQDATVTLADLPVKVRAAFFEPAAPPAPAALAAAASPSPTMGAVGADGVDLNAALEQMERQLIAEALEKTGGNKNRAAALLKIRRTTLVEKLKRLGQG
jgi:DNA-binding NtrC family response regulator